jgi:hypothetical protein
MDHLWNESQAIGTVLHEDCELSETDETFSSSSSSSSSSSPSPPLPLAAASTSGLAVSLGSQALPSRSNHCATSSCITLTNTHGDAIAVPQEFICPITMEIMNHPMVSRFGHTYEHDAITYWIVHGNGCCPVTRQRISFSDIIPHHAMKIRIAAWFYERDIDIAPTTAATTTTTTSSTTSTTTQSHVQQLTPWSQLHIDSKHDSCGRALKHMYVQSGMSSTSMLSPSPLSIHNQINVQSNETNDPTIASHIDVHPHTTTRSRGISPVKCHRIYHRFFPKKVQHSAP